MKVLSLVILVFALTAGPAWLFLSHKLDELAERDFGGGRFMPPDSDRGSFLPRFSQTKEEYERTIQAPTKRSACDRAGQN